MTGASLEWSSSLLQHSSQLVVILLDRQVNIVANLHGPSIPLNNVVELSDLRHLDFFVRGRWLYVLAYLLVTEGVFVEQAVHEQYLTQFVIHYDVHHGHEVADHEQSLLQQSVQRLQAVHYVIHVTLDGVRGIVLELLPGFALVLGFVFLLNEFQDLLE